MVFRPQRNAHQALKRSGGDHHGGTYAMACRGGTSRVSFDQVSHDHLKRFLAHRIGDPRLLRIIDRFLKAGCWRDGAFSASDQGYATRRIGFARARQHLSALHIGYLVLRQRASRSPCQGKAFLVRYADDLSRLLHTGRTTLDGSLTENSGTGSPSSSAWEWEPTKTRLLRFGDQARRNANTTIVADPLPSISWA